MKEITSKLCELSSKLEESKLEDFEKIWFEYFQLYLISQGFNETSIKQLFNWGVHGHNWKDLHLENTEFKDKTIEELTRSFLGETFYISDRMSLDRLFRTHWLFNQILMEEKIKEHLK